MRDMFRDFVGKRRHYPFQGQNDACNVSYKRFRRWIHFHRSGTEAPAVSTPLTTGRRQRERSFEWDTVCQRLELDSPPTHHEAAPGGLQGALQETTLEGGLSHRPTFIPLNTSHTISARGRPASQNVSQQGWMWRAAVEEPVSTQQTGADVRRCSLLPFTVLDKAPESPQGGSVMKLAAPSLLNDYYTNVLDCSCNGTVALALGSSVFLWNSETRALVGSLEPSPQTGRHQSVSSLCWSRDGRALCIGTRRGEVELWDVENKQNMRCLPSHLSVVGALSWQQQLLSSGSVLGRIHHLDPRAPAPLVGAAVQDEGICSLQWSPGDDWLASGSTDGLLHIWDRDIAGPTRTKQPVTTMKQPSAVKAMGWCPWQEKIIATGGGWKDGELRIWDTQSGTCVNSANTNSQICSLRWAEKKKCLVTGHGLPHHQVTCWSWGSASLNPVCQLTVVCLVVAVAQIPSHHFLFQRPMSWSKAREFCQRYYVDLAVLNTEEQYFSVLNATLGSKVSFWLGLRRQSSLSNWTWVNGEELKYTHWYRRNHRSLCASLESMLDKDEKLLARFCDEPHMFVCQGPLAPQTAVKAASVGNGQLNLSWNISAFMQMTPHSYNVTTCTSTCDTVLYSYTDGSAFMSVNISNLTPAPETFIHVAAFVVRPDAVTGGERILQSDPTTLHFKTDILFSLADSTKQHNVIPVILKLLKIVSLVPPLWILYRIIKKGFELDHDVSIHPLRE